MLDSTAPIPLAAQLPADAYWHLIRTLRLTLPRPPGDSPDDLRKRDHAAIACVAALAPGNAAEGKLAARFVAASEHSDACLRLAQTPETTPEWATKCRAQALSMMREANSIRPPKTADQLRLRAAGLRVHFLARLCTA